MKYHVRNISVSVNFMNQVYRDMGSPVCLIPFNQ